MLGIKAGKKGFFVLIDPSFQYPINPIFQLGRGPSGREANCERSELSSIPQTTLHTMSLEIIHGRG